MNANSDCITAEIVKDNQRMDFLIRKCNDMIGLMLALENQIYLLADICEQYQGGYWEFVNLSNGGFFMFPDSQDTLFSVTSPNGTQADLTDRAFGLYVTLISLNQIAWATYQSAPKTSEHASSLYHALRHYLFDYCKQDPEQGRAVLELID